MAGDYGQFRLDGLGGLVLEAGAYKSYRFVAKWNAESVPSGPARIPGKKLMSDPSSPAVPGGGEDPHECAKQIGDQIASLIKVARSKRFDFLAYLMAMALRESRRLSKDDR